MIRIAPITSSDPNQPLVVTECQALIEEPLDVHIPKKWWAALRNTTIWHVWLARNLTVIQKKPEHPKATKANIWMQMKTYLIAEGEEKRQQIIVGKCDEFRVSYDFN